MESKKEKSDYVPPFVGSIEVPSTVLRKTSGVSCDIGGSLAKFVYFSNEGQATRDDGRTTLNLVSFPRDDLDAGLSYINEHFTSKVPNGDWRNEKVTTTGIGSYQYKTKISEALKVGTANLDNLLEVDCFIKTIQLLGKTVPKAELMNGIDEAARDQMKSVFEALFKMMQDLKAAGHLKDGMEVPVDEQLLEDFEKESTGKDDVAVQYPCVVCMIGSGAAAFKLNEDGSYVFLDMSNLAGKTFLGLGSLLTGAKTFEELIRLAENGSSENVDVMSKDLHVDGADDSGDAYGAFTTELNVLTFSFGKCANKDLGDFKKEDIARCLLANMCLILTQVAQCAALNHGIKRIYFCGSFVGHDLVRKDISRAISTRAMLNPKEQIALKYGFVKYGGHLGAIGALLYAQDEKYSKTLGSSADDTVKEKTLGSSADDTVKEKTLGSSADDTVKEKTLGSSADDTVKETGQKTKTEPNNNKTVEKKKNVIDPSAI